MSALLTDEAVRAARDEWLHSSSGYVAEAMEALVHFHATEGREALVAEVVGAVDRAVRAEVARLKYVGEWKDADPFDLMLHAGDIAVETVVTALVGPPS